MKIRYLVIISLIVAIITMGAVSASDDVISDDNLTAADSIAEIDDSGQLEEHAILADSNDEESIVKSDNSGFDTDISPGEIMEGESVNVVVTGPKVEGWLYVGMDGGDYCDYYYFDTGRVNVILSDLSVGVHTIEVSFNDYGYSYHFTRDVTVKINMSGKLNFADLYNEINSAKEEITLENDYKFNPETDKCLELNISDPITVIDGNNHIIDATKQAISFNIQNDNAVLKNIIFRNVRSKSYDNLIVLSGQNITLYNCTFEDNSIRSNLIYGCFENITIDKCSFTDNSVDSYDNNYLINISGKNGKITNCVFKDNSGHYICSSENVYVDNGVYDFQIDLRNCTYIGDYWDEGYLVKINNYGLKSGNVKIYLDNREVFNKRLLKDDGFEILSDELNWIPTGIRDMRILFDDGESELVVHEGKVDFDYSLSICPDEDDDEYLSSNIIFSGSSLFRVELPKGATGILSVSYEGYNNPDAKYDKETYPNYIFKVSANGLSVGTHKITARLTNDPRYCDKTIEYTFNVVPKITVPEYVSVGESEFITVEFPTDYKGVVTLFKGTYIDSSHSEYTKDKIIGTANVVNGFAKLPVKNLVLGYNLILVNCTGSGDYECDYTINYFKNNPKFSARINSNVIEVGKDVILTIKCPKSSEGLYIYVDDKFYRYVELDKTKITRHISKLRVGKHKIKLTFCESSYDGEDVTYYGFFSKSFYVTVKKATKITAKKKTFKVKTKVKRYTVTLKSGRAVLKKVQLTLKVNKKTYKAKTNNKGKATFKIKNLKKKGRYTAVIRFKGNNKYKASTKKVRFTVKR